MTVEYFASAAAYHIYVRANPSAAYVPYPGCPPTVAPAAPAPAPAPPPDPATLAIGFWKTIPLPVPEPTIPPGYAICGKLSYLVTGDTVDPAPYRFNTVLGPLTITVTGSYEVDWGDGDPSGFTGPYSVVGQPYPNGRITHTYDDVGSYNVVVHESWSAVWKLGAATGTLTGLQTAATIDGFQVQQLQAVITN